MSFPFGFRPFFRGELLNFRGVVTTSSGCQFKFGIFKKKNRPKSPKKKVIAGNAPSLETDWVGVFQHVGSEKRFSQWLSGRWCMTISCHCLRKNKRSFGMMTLEQMTLWYVLVRNYPNTNGQKLVVLVQTIDSKNLSIQTRLL